MMTKSNNTVVSMADDEKVYEITAIAFASVMILVSIFVIAMNVRLSQSLNTRRKHPSVKKVRKMLVKGRAAVRSGYLTAEETVILALEAGMTMEDVRLEYVNSIGTREEILEGLFGKSEHDQKLFTKMKASGRFMETGYANEKVFLDLWKSESYRELVFTQQREECRTQSYIASIEDAPPPSSAPCALTSANRSPTQLKTKANNEKSTTTSSSIGSKGAISANRRKTAIIDMKMLSCVPEGKPLICRGNADDAQ